MTIAKKYCMKSLFLNSYKNFGAFIMIISITSPSFSGYKNDQSYLQGPKLTSITSIYSNFYFSVNPLMEMFPAIPILTAG